MRRSSMLGSDLGLKMRESRLVGWMVGRYPGGAVGRWMPPATKPVLDRFV